MSTEVHNYAQEWLEEDKGIRMNKNGKKTEPTVNELQEQLTAMRRRTMNALLGSRSELFKKFLDPRRDINDECGYKQTNELTPTVYRDLYDREAIAQRCVAVLPDETWSSQPLVFETEEVDNKTEFEKAWEEVAKDLTHSEFFNSQEGNPIWEHLRRVDILSGIGTFGVLLLGFDDLEEGETLAKPVEGVNLVTGKKEGNATRKLLFLRAFDASQVQVTTYESNPASIRFGQPTQYNVTFHNPTDSDNSTSSEAVGRTEAVHWTRILHVADNIGSSETFGTPRLQPLYNRVYDLIKLYSGSAEMYWKGAFPGISLETHPSLGGDVEIDSATTKQMMTDYMDGLQRYLITSGTTANSLAPQVVDPSPQIETQLDALCIQLAIPKRIFLGSERGELASSQDDEMHNERIGSRQRNYVTPRIIVPFIHRLIATGVLPEPPEGFFVRWPDLDSITELEKATIAEVKTKALVAYASSDNATTLVAPADFLVRYQGMSQEEAEATVENALENVDDDDSLLETEGDEDGERDSGDLPESEV